MFYWAALYVILGSSNHSIYFQLLNIFQWILREETKGKESTAKKKLHTLKIFLLQTLTILKFLIWNVLLMSFFLPQLRVGRLLPGHTDFEQGIHYGKSPLSLLLILYIIEKKCNKILYTTLSLCFLFALVFVVVHHCLTWCQWQVHSLFFKFYTITINRSSIYK